MSGMDDNGAVLADWASLNPSPRTFFSTLLNDDLSSRSFSDIRTENRSQVLAPGSEKQKTSTDFNKKEYENGGGAFGDHPSESNVSSDQKPSSKGGLAERMAARAGFNAPRLNTARITSASLSSSSPEIQSPYLTIPPGLSPTTLLDSPVFLSNSLVQQSPTTGKFFFPQFGDNGLISLSAAPDKNKDYRFEDIDDASFAFKPHVESRSAYFPRVANNVAVPGNQHQSFPSIEVSVQSERPIHAQIPKAAEIDSSTRQEHSLRQAFHESFTGNDAIGNTASDSRVSEPCSKNADQYSPPEDQEDGEGEQRGEFSSLVVGAPSEDGFNWRKYGQKQVKGSEFPRSYYKCTHPNCQVKKKVERSHEGHITEIIYKGAHNHPKPPPNRRSGIGSSYPSNELDNNTEQHGTPTRFDAERLTWANTERGNVIGGGEWVQHDGMDTTSSLAVPTNPPTSAPTQNGLPPETIDVRDVSSTVSNDDDDDDDDRGTHGSVSLGYDDEGDESESKRRKIDACVAEISGATRAIREPRVVVQTTSEVDILDDGYRWRKYGQKVVKGNPNPRSYYKCTNAGCTVRKHVERASHDLKSVITTYEGKHNHDVPAARNSSHVNSGQTNVAPSPAAPSYIPRPEPSQARTSIPRFDGSMLGMFSLPARQQMGPTSGFSFAMGQPGLANLSMSGLTSATQGQMPGLSMNHSHLGQQQQRKVDDVGFMMPKGEPKEEPSLESSLSVSNGSSAYYQLMNNCLEDLNRK